MYLFFDTETTGLPRNWKASVTDVDNWPRLVQLAYLQYDRSGNLLAQKNFIIRPEGFVIPADSSRIHGITTERARSEGVSLLPVLEHFRQLVAGADCLVAHNMSFDEKIVGAELLRAQLPNSLTGKRKICTMESATDFCALPGRFGYKWPTLSELHHRLFGTGFDEAHNAAVDITATAKCFWELKRVGALKLTPA